jgi:hypothetical protein
MTTASMSPRSEADGSRSLNLGGPEKRRKKSAEVMSEGRLAQLPANVAGLERATVVIDYWLF